MNPMQTKNKENFTWTGEYQEAFDLLKTHLTSIPVLDYQISFDHLNWRLMHLYKGWVPYFPKGMKMALAIS